MIVKVRKRTVPDLSGKGKATRIFLPSRVNLEIKILAFPFTHASNGAKSHELYL